MYRSQSASKGDRAYFLGKAYFLRVWVMGGTPLAF
jgi:hypothetical protein